MTISAPARFDLVDRRFAVLVGTFLAVYNNIAHLVPGQRSLYIPMNLAVAGVLVASARRRGLSWPDLGLSRSSGRRGVIWGAAVATVVVVGYAVVLLSPLQGLLQDERYADLGPARLSYLALVRIPLGTVVLEELAFRGVLLAAVARAWSLRAAVVVSSSLFGLWHIRPTLSALEANDVGGSAASVAAGAAAAVVFTALAGVLFSWLRLRSGSLAAPMLLHLTTNSAGVLAAFLAHRWG